MSEVTPGGPAANAGIQPGDIITAIGGDDVLDARDLVERIALVLPCCGIQLAERRRLGVLEVFPITTSPGSSTASLVPHDSVMRVERLLSCVGSRWSVLTPSTSRWAGLLHAAHGKEEDS